MDLYAQWTPVKFTLMNGSTQVAQFDAAETLTQLAQSNKPDAGANQFFAGYYTQEGGKGIQVYDSNLNPTAAGLAHDFTSNTTLYAHFVSTQHNVVWDYSYRVDENSYHNLDTHANHCRLEFLDAAGQVIAGKTVFLTAPTVGNKDTKDITDAIDTHTTSKVTINLAEGTQVNESSDGTATIYFTKEVLESIRGYQLDVWNGTNEEAKKAEHWETETNETTNTTIFKYTGKHEGNMFTLGWTVTLHNLAMYPDKIYAKPMVKKGDNTYNEISPMSGMDGLECLRTELAGDGSSATYTGEYAVLRTQGQGAPEYHIGMTGFHLAGSDYFLNATHGTVSNDFISSTSASNPGSGKEEASISYDIYDYQIPIVLLQSGATDATINSALQILYVDQARTGTVSLAQFVAERPHFNFVGWYDTEWTEGGKNKVWETGANYDFHVGVDPQGGTRTLIAQWQRDSKPEASLEMTEEANRFDYTITATDAVEVKAVKYMTADEEPAADDTNWEVVVKNNDKYVVSIDRTNSDYGKYLYVMVENEGQYVIVKCEEPIRSFIDITANPDPDSAIENGGSYTYYSTYYNSTQAFKPVNATAYKVCAVNGHSLSLSEITTTENDGISTAVEGEEDYIAPQGEVILPKREAVILKGSSEKITLELVNSDVKASADNQLEGVDDQSSQTGDNKYYKLSYAQYGLGFYLMDDGEKLAAHKAFVKTEKSSSVRAFIFDFSGNDSTVNAIREIEDSEKNDGTIYDLSGRKLSNANMRGGIYLKGGSKLLK